jgi:hypothetical protein
MLLPFLGLSVIGLAVYAISTELWIRYIFAHIMGLGVIGLLGCCAGSIARHKGYGYCRAFYIGFVPPLMLGIISVCIVHTLGGHGCGGIVSLSAGMIVILFYSLTKKRA